MKAFCIKAGLVVLALWLVCVLASGDREFRTAAGFSPGDFGAQHHLSFKELTSILQGYYEYSMPPEDFQDMLQFLTPAEGWEVRHDTSLYWNPSTPSGIRDGWTCLKATERCHSWLIYDAEQHILYAGYFRH